MSINIIYLDEKQIEKYLDWNDLIPAMEENFSDVSSVAQFADTITIQPARGFMHIPHRNAILLTMPGLSERKKALSCKLVTSFTDNPTRFKIPSILATITLFNPDTGKLKAVLEGTTITEWRTAAASVVATKHLWKPTPDGSVLTVLGAGRQGRIHIIAFHNYFNFQKICLWNRTPEHAEQLAEELKQDYNITVEIFAKVEECTKHADVIVTATYASKPILKYENIKPNVVINAIGAGINHHSELDQNIYEKSVIYTDSMENAKKELKGLEDEGYQIEGEIGEIIINGKEFKHEENRPIIFHSLGMATEDAVAAQLVLDKYLKENENDAV